MIKVIRIVTIVLFVFCLGVGFSIARIKPLWNDEVYSQKESVQQLTFVEILLGKVPEGNNCPLFYSLQKITSQLFQCPIPSDVPVGEWIDARAQIILRVPAVIFMSLAIVFIFYFFSVYFSLGWGIYALAVALSSFTVWAYWAESRHYALWFLLTVAQSLMFLKIIWKNEESQREWIKFGWINLLLSLTVIFGAVQIVVASVLLWLFHRKDLKSYIFPAVIPLSLSVFYFLKAPRYHFKLPSNSFDLILLNISWAQWMIFGFYALCILLIAFLDKSKRFKKEAGVNIYVIFIFVMSVIAGILLCALKFTEGINRVGFEFTYRYFIFLTPLGIIATTLVSRQFVEWARESFWLRINILISLGALLVLRILKIFMLALGLLCALSN